MESQLIHLSSNSSTNEPHNEHFPLMIANCLKQNVSKINQPMSPTILEQLVAPNYTNDQSKEIKVEIKHEPLDEHFHLPLTTENCFTHRNLTSKLNSTALNETTTGQSEITVFDNVMVVIKEEPQDEHYSQYEDNLCSKTVPTIVKEIKTDRVESCLTHIAANDYSKELNVKNEPQDEEPQQPITIVNYFSKNSQYVNPEMAALVTLRNDFSAYSSTSNSYSDNKKVKKRRAIIPINTLAPEERECRRAQYRKRYEKIADELKKQRQKKKCLMNIADRPKLVSIHELPPEERERRRALYKKHNDRKAVKLREQGQQNHNFLRRSRAIIPINKLNPVERECRRAQYRKRYGKIADKLKLQRQKNKCLMNVAENKNDEKSMAVTPIKKLTSEDLQRKREQHKKYNDKGAAELKGQQIPNCLTKVAYSPKILNKLVPIPELSPEDRERRRTINKKNNYKRAVKLREQQRQNQNFLYIASDNKRVKKCNVVIIPILKLTSQDSERRRVQYREKYEKRADKLNEQRQKRNYLTNVADYKNGNGCVKKMDDNLSHPEMLLNKMTAKQGENMVQPVNAQGEKGIVHLANAHNELKIQFKEEPQGEGCPEIYFWPITNCSTGSSNDFKQNMVSTILNETAKEQNESRNVLPSNEHKTEAINSQHTNLKHRKAKRVNDQNTSSYRRRELFLKSVRQKMQTSDAKVREELNELMPSGQETLKQRYERLTRAKELERERYCLKRAEINKSLGKTCSIIKSKPRFFDKDRLPEFIQDYKSNHCLWDTDHKDYKKQKLKNEAMLALASKYGMTREETRRKIMSLRSQYGGERTQLSKNKDYKPIYWFNDFKFIDTKVCRKRRFSFSRKKLPNFIQDYKLNECLWNKKCEDFTNSDVKNSALQKLGSKYGLTAKQTKMKITCLRSVYTTESNKMKHSGGAYKTTPYWFHDFDFVEESVRWIGPRKNKSNCKDNESISESDVDNVQQYSEHHTEKEEEKSQSFETNECEDVSTFTNISSFVLQELTM